MNVVALSKIVAWLCDIYNSSLLICFGNNENFLIMQLNLTCRKDHVQSPTRKEGWDLFWRTSDDSSVRRFTPINIHEDEPEDPRVRDTVTKERDSEEYKNHDMTKP